MEVKGLAIQLQVKASGKWEERKAATHMVLGKVSASGQQGVGLISWSACRLWAYVSLHCSDADERNRCGCFVTPAGQRVLLNQRFTTSFQF
mmetsp:Transcript_46204/g.83250  ORF Transcript_46204/g.83250 Transcript_46204/m.83250 type:complete len:91 (-) Transcript_46204:74-346(-)